MSDEEVVYENCRMRNTQWTAAVRMSILTLQGWLEVSKLNGPLPRGEQIADLVHGLYASWGSAVESNSVSQKVGRG